MTKSERFASQLVLMSYLLVVTAGFGHICHHRTQAVLSGLEQFRYLAGDSCLPVYVISDACGEDVLFMWLVVDTTAPYDRLKLLECAE